MKAAVEAAVRKQQEEAGARPLFSRETRALVYLMAAHPLKRMLDFDYLCQRAVPSVAAIIQPDSKAAHQLAQYGPREVKIPIFASLAKAVAAFPEADVLINYAQKGAVFPTSLIALNTQSIRTVVITSEGVPERDIKRLVAAAERNRKVLIGPGTVGGLAAGAFKIGDTSGTAENVIMCKLYRPGSIGAVCRSSGMLNELCYLLAKHTDGLREGVVVGAHRFLCSTMLAHVLRLQAVPEVRIIVVVGEPGGTGELEIAAALRAGAITKPVVAWVLGSCADRCVPVDLRYGRASTASLPAPETATAKLAALRAAGFVVPASFDALGPTIAAVYKRLVEAGQLIPATDSPSQFIAAMPPHSHHRQSSSSSLATPVNASPVALAPTSTTTTASTATASPPIHIPSPARNAAGGYGNGGGCDDGTTAFSATATNATNATAMNATGTTAQSIVGAQIDTAAVVAPSPLTFFQQQQFQQQQQQREGRKQQQSTSHPRNTIISSISDDRVNEPAYCGQPLSQLLQEHASIGDVIALLWFKRRVPPWASQFLELCVVVLADKGPCAPAAHSAIVASRSGKDVVACLCAGLLNVGPRYGGGGDDAARCWLAAVEAKLTPAAFVAKMRAQAALIRGIGVPVAAKGAMPEHRTGFLKAYALQHFPTRRFLAFAEGVERITSSKSPSLVLNLDGVLGALFLDMMDGCPAFSKTEMADLVTFGCLSGLFAFSRSIGLIGHAIDQKRLKQPLYFHQFDDVNYVNQSLV